MPVIPALGRLRQEDCEFKASLDYIKTLSQNTSVYVCVCVFVGETLDLESLESTCPLRPPQSENLYF
jgi:hypothetical protein